MTGWPTPPLIQDDYRPLFQWFSNQLGARRLINQAAQAIKENTMLPEIAYRIAVEKLFELGYVWDDATQQWISPPFFKAGQE